MTRISLAIVAALAFLNISASHAQTTSDLADRAAFYYALDGLCPGIVPKAVISMAIDRAIAAAGEERKDGVIQVIAERSFALKEKTDDDGVKRLCRDVRQELMLEGDAFWK